MVSLCGLVEFGVDQVQVGIIADDLTGAMDSGAQLARSGYRVAVAFYGAPLPTSVDLDAIAVDTDSRQLDAKPARGRVSAVARRLRDARILYKKIDSTLRGPIAAEIEAAFTESGRSTAIIAPAFPGSSRTTLGGVQLVHDRPVHETRFAKDPVTPVLEGHIPSLLSEAGLDGVGTLETGALDEPGKVRDVLAKHRWIVADSTDDAHLRSLVESVPDPAEVLWIGSAGLVKALGEVYPGPRVEEILSEALPSRRVLVVVGSMNEVSRKQIQNLENEPGVESVEISATALTEKDKDPIEEASRKASEALLNGENVALYSSDEDLSGELSERADGHVVEGLANIVAGLSEGGLFDALVLTGGDTAVHVSRELGAQGIMLEGEIEPGVATGTLIGPRPYRVITKAGGFGNPETLLHALHTLKGKGK